LGVTKRSGIDPNYPVSWEVHLATKYGVEGGLNLWCPRNDFGTLSFFHFLMYVFELAIRNRVYAVVYTPGEARMSKMD
jgi:hypothetical protein